ncbi:MAG TPA: ArsR family transcriptional regulator [candidate division WWE3 bacterium]|uniref:ArsR family transcriptional regulator n=1 Tax=candidate division WWE3 bacterium TaxID=2053526 RepID=A0A7V5J044_UNCKA|nr:ArsR family transcriptional regulator [candidate division WWE3 bacterium]
MVDKKILLALSSPTRVTLLGCLKNKPKTVSELLTSCSVTQSAVSQHLKVLKEAGLLDSKKVGKQVYYSIKKPEVVDLYKILIKLSKE